MVPARHFISILANRNANLNPNNNSDIYKWLASALCLLCLSICVQDTLESCGWISMKHYFDRYCTSPEVVNV